MDARGWSGPCTPRELGKVYGPSNTQEQIYADMVAPQVDRVPAGYNCTLFAYGQTGSGKTYTVGRLGERSPYKNDKTTGMIPRAVEHIFEELERPNTEEYNVRVSYLELYNEELFDLLAATPEYRERLRIFDDASQRGMASSFRKSLAVPDRAQSRAGKLPVEEYGGRRGTTAARHGSSGGSTATRTVATSSNQQQQATEATRSNMNMYMFMIALDDGE
uniref:Kinesin motor domain-containing protein n=1 Tax=Haemonchus contortus TaxID=6289 RepID=A0A7I4XSE2_HAECO